MFFTIIKKLTIIYFLIVCLPSFGQHIGLTFQEAEKQGVSITYLNSIYKSAIHTDTSLAVFKLENEQNEFQQSYIKFLQDFGKFLSYNKLKWEKQTRCFNRIYFNSNGSIDYFIFNFIGKEDEKPSEEIRNKFQKLLNVFILDYQFSISAKVKFAQCSPVNYNDD